MPELLAPCPCGKTPEDLGIDPGDTCKWAWVHGDCCGEWNIEFRTDFYEVDSEECMVLATKAWNDAPRK